MANIQKIESFSCGRGVHRVFVGGLIPRQVGWAIFQHNGQSQIEISSLTLLGRISAIFERLRIKNSMYFGETTKVTLSSISEALK